MNTCYIASTYSTCSVEEIAAAAPNGYRWFQLYLYQNRKLSEQIVHRVEALGYKALVFTVDVPYTGKRRNDIRNQFKLPPHLKVKNFERMFQVGQLFIYLFFNIWTFKIYYTVKQGFLGHQGNLRENKKIMENIFKAVKVNALT